MIKAAYRKSNPVKDAIVLGLLKFLAFLPQGFVRLIGRLFAEILFLFPTKTKNVIRRNVELCLTHFDHSEQKKIIKASFIHTVFLAFELPVAWLGKQKSIEKQLMQVEGDERLKILKEENTPVIIALPHIGNWEFFWHWLQLNYPSIAMYSPSKNKLLDKLMLKSRKRFGGVPFSADSKGILGLMRAIKKGNVMVILPDQAPKEGSGIYSEFFKLPAYTMTLLHRFVEKTGAKVLFGECIFDSQLNGYRVGLYEPTEELPVDDVEQFNLKMNGQIEEMILRSPEQYQWSYKRFKRQADGKSFYKNSNG